MVVLVSSWWLPTCARTHVQDSQTPELPATGTQEDRWRGTFLYGSPEEGPFVLDLVYVKICGRIWIQMVYRCINNI